MKRFVVPIFALFAILGPSLAHAEWVSKEIQWRISNQGPCGTCTQVWIRDTLRTSIGPVDTTAGFSLDEAQPIPRGLLAPGVTGLAALNVAGTTQNDTTIIAYVVIQSDSSLAPTAPALTSITALIDGRLGGFGPPVAMAVGQGWVKADSALANGAAGGGMILADQCVAFPIRTMSPYGAIFRFSELRARITGVGGAVGIAAARVWLRYWRPDVAPRGN